LSSARGTSTRIETGFRYGCSFVAAYSTNHSFAG
jgi:hypothetical protein